MQTKHDFFVKEDLEFLQNWLDQSKEFAQSLRSQAQKGGVIAIFTISTTIKANNNLQPYFTPIRRIIHGFVGGAVVFSQTQAILLSKLIDGKVDLILVDAEKKIGVTLGTDEAVLKHFGLQPSKIGKIQSRVYVEMGNLSTACANIIKKSQFHEYKPNDMTVEAVWHFLSNHFRILSGKKMAIIGGGNIGFKLALKLVESGTSIELVRRDMARGRLMADVIDVSKPKSTLATAHYNSDPQQASLFSDAIIGCTNGTRVISWEMIQSMKPEGIVIDVGKGSIYEDAVTKAIKNNIQIMRCDISSAIDGLIATIQRNKEIVEKEMGRREIEKGVFVVSGGQLGQDGDIMVDNYNKPNQIYGIADGSGDIKRDLAKSEEKKILNLKKFLNTNNYKSLHEI
jgi:hypothetical protein